MDADVIVVAVHLHLLMEGKHMLLPLYVLMSMVQNEHRRYNNVRFYVSNLITLVGF